MATTTEMITASGVQVSTEQDFDLEIPVCAGLMRQGDVLIRPTKVTARTPVPPAGTPVVRGEASGNTHTIIADGPVYCDLLTGPANDLRIATLSVPQGSTAYLAHPEHGFTGIAPGTYEIRRQREMAEQMRMVAD